MNARTCEARREDALLVAERWGRVATAWLDAERSCRDGDAAAAAAGFRAAAHAQLCAEAEDDDGVQEGADAAAAARARSAAARGKRNGGTS